MVSFLIDFGRKIFNRSWRNGFILRLKGEGVSFSTFVVSDDGSYVYEGWVKVKPVDLSKGTFQSMLNASSSRAQGMLVFMQTFDAMKIENMVKVKMFFESMGMAKVGASYVNKLKTWSDVIVAMFDHHSKDFSETRGFLLLRQLRLLMDTKTCPVCESELECDHVGG